MWVFGLDQEVVVFDWECWWMNAFWVTIGYVQLNNVKSMVISTAPSLRSAWYNWLQLPLWNTIFRFIFYLKMTDTGNWSILSQITDIILAIIFMWICLCVCLSLSYNQLEVFQPNVQVCQNFCSSKIVNHSSTQPQP